MAAQMNSHGEWHFWLLYLNILKYYVFGEGVGIKNSFSHVTVVTSLICIIPRPLFSGVFVMFQHPRFKVGSRISAPKLQDDEPPQEEVWLRARGSDYPEEVAAEQFQVPPGIHRSKVLHSWHRGKWSIIAFIDLKTWILKVWSATMCIEL